MKLTNIKGVVAVFMLCASMQAMALSSDQNQPIYIEANSVEIDDRKGASTYSGDVVLTQGTIKIDADIITVTQKAGKSDYVVATGKPMKFQQQADNKKTVKGSANKMEYAVNSEIIHMTGNAKLNTGTSNFTSQKIIYDRAKAIVKAGTAAGAKKSGKSSGRVRMTIGGN